MTLEKPDGDLPRPDVDGLSDVESLNLELQTIEERQALIMNELIPKTLAELSRSTQGELRHALLRYIYWQLKYIPGKLLARAFTGKKSALALHNLLVPPVSRTFVCPICSAVFSRNVSGVGASALPSDSEEQLCVSCMRIEADRRMAEHAAQWSARRVEDRTMSRDEYEKSEHWRSLCESLFEEVRFRCQLCNAVGCELKVHARSRQLRGEEKRSELVVICISCYEVHLAQHDRDV